MAHFRAGLSELVITPPVGVRLSGYAERTSPSTGVLDDLYCKALVMDDGSRRLVLLVCDVLGLSRSIVAAIRESVRAACGLEARDVMITAIHTHCGPDIDLLPETAVDHLVAQVAGAARAAAGALADATVGWGAAECLTGVSRRYPRAPQAPYFLYSDPEGAMDPRVLVLSVQDRAGAPLGAVVNYACHPVTLGWTELNMSKDYVEFTCQVLKGAWGRRAVPVFLQGCAGNINPRWVYDRPDLDPAPEPSWPEGLSDRLRETRRLGYMLGGAALAAASSIMKSEEALSLDARLVEVRLPVRPDLPRDLAEGREESRPGGKYPALHQRLRASPRELVTDVQVLRVGRAYVVGLPGEVFVEYQQELQEKIDSPCVLVSELSGDSISYVPTAAAVREGGYEPMVCAVTPEAGGILVRAVLQAVRDMTR